jgi:hypothetical protein
MLLALLGLTETPARGETAEVLPVDGPPWKAELLKVDADWKLGFQAADGTRQIAAEDLVRWGSPQELSRGPVLVLADGGLLVADVLEAGKEAITVDSPLFGQVQVPLERLAGVAFQLPADEQERDRLIDAIASSTGESDQVVLTNGDRVTGRFQGFQEATARLETNVGPVDVQRHRIRALVFNPALLRRDSGSGLRAVVGFRDGSRLIAKKLELNGPALSISPSEGAAWSTSREELAYLQPLGGKAVYLSDLKAADYRHVPFLDLAWPYRTDRSVTGTWLRAAGTQCLKGLGLHSASRLTYQLTEPYRHLEARLAVDDTAGGRGSVRFRVFVDGVLKHTSPTIRGGMAPVPVSVDLRGAKRLDLVVDFADRADEMDRADVLEARLVR